MSDEVVDLRARDRYLFHEPFPGTFNGSDVALLNIAISGLQIVHSEPLRLGFRGVIAFQSVGNSVAAHARVAWSRLQQTEGKLVYRSGLKLEAPDAQYALALNQLIRKGLVQLDSDALERKKQRLRERAEERRKATFRFLPSTRRED